MGGYILIPPDYPKDELAQGLHGLGIQEDSQSFIDDAAEHHGGSQLDGDLGAG
jgi:hypothetical protein